MYLLQILIPIYGLSSHSMSLDIVFCSTDVFFILFIYLKNFYYHLVPLYLPPHHSHYTEFLILVKSCLSATSFIDHVFGVIFNSYCHPKSHLHFLLCYCLGVLQFSVLHQVYDPFSVKSVRSESVFIFLNLFSMQMSNCFSTTY